MKPDFQESEFARSTFGHLEKRRKSRKRGQQLLGLVLLVVGYFCLAVTADTASDWLLLRVVGGFGMLFVGFVLVVRPMLASVFGGHD